MVDKLFVVQKLAMRLRLRPNSHDACSSRWIDLWFEIGDSIIRPSRLKRTRSYISPWFFRRHLLSTHREHQSARESFLTADETKGSAGGSPRYFVELSGLQELATQFLFGSIDIPSRRNHTTETRIQNLVAMIWREWNRQNRVNGGIRSPIATSGREKFIDSYP